MKNRKNKRINDNENENISREDKIKARLLYNKQQSSQ